MMNLTLLLPELQVAAFNLAVALACGVLIGTERQARKRMAGVRTNALVALGAAAFVFYAARTLGDASPPVWRRRWSPALVFWEQVSFIGMASAYRA